MKTKASWLAVVVILLGHGVAAWASSPCGIYARIEEVRVGPDEDQPTWIVIKGDFLLGLNKGRLLAPARGYMCFSLEKADEDRNGSFKDRVPFTGKNKEKCLIEWDDLKSLVKEKGKGKAYVAFGSASSERLQRGLKIYETDEKARQNQFPYPVNHGLTKLRIPAPRDREALPKDQTDRNPVLVLQEFQAKKDQEAQTKKDQESQSKKDGPSR